MDFGERAKKAGIEGRLTPEAMAANRITRLAQGQIASFDRLTNFVNNVREGRQDVSEERAMALRDVAERVKDTSIGMALTEMQARRAQAGKPALTTQEQIDAVGKLEQVMREAIERGAGLFEKPVTVGEKAQMRANKIVRGSTEEQRRAPAGARVFNNYAAAAASLRAQVRQIIDETVGVTAPETKKRPPAQARKGEEGLRLQFQGQERSTEQQFNAALAKADDAEYRALEEVRSMFGSLSPEAQDMAMEQVRRVETGRGLDMPRQLEEEVKDLRQARVDEGAQNELFPGASEKGVTRTTSKRFMNFLDSGEVQKLRAALAEDARQAEFQAKRAATIAAKAEAEARKAEEFVKKVEAAKNKTPLEKAQAVLDKVNAEDSPVQLAIQTAEAIRRQRLQARQRIASMVEQIETAHTKAKEHLDETQSLYDYIVQQYLTKPKNQKVNVGLDFYEKELKKAEKTFESADRALKAAKATQLRIAEDHASDTINNALVREGEKAARELERAKEAVLKARGDEVKAANALEKAKLEIPQQPKEPTLREQAEAATVERTVQAYRDTSDPETQKKVKAMRGIIAKDEEAYDDAVTAGDMDEAKTIADRIQESYDKINDILNNAPYKVVTPETAAEAKAFAEFEKAQQNTLEAEIAQIRLNHNLPALKLSKRKIEGVVRTNRGAVRSAIKEPSVAEQEREAKTAPKSTLEKIAETRVELNTVQAQIDYIAANKSATKEGRAKQAAARKEAVAKRDALKTQLKDLAVEQATMVREAKFTKKETKQIRTVGKEYVRADNAAAKALEDVYSGEFEGKFQSVAGAPAVNLSDDAVAELENNNIRAALNDIEQTSTNKLNRAVAARVKLLLRGTDVRIVDGLKKPNGEAVYGAASTDGTAVYLDRGTGLNEETLLHESVHAATERILQMDESQLSPEQIAAKRELEALFDAIKNDPSITSENAKEDLSEFVAEALSNNALQAQLQAKPWTLRNAWESFKKILLDMIGVKAPTNMLDATLAAVDTLMAASVRPTAADKTLATPTKFRTIKYANSGLSAAGDIADKLIAKQQGLVDRIRANSSGLAFETQIVDRFAGFERLAKTMTPLKGSQMMYYLRMYDQRMNFVAQSVGNGALQIVEKKRADGQKEFLIESKAGPSLKGVVDILKDAPAGSPDAANRLFTMYLAAKRAERVGLDKLNFNGRVTQADLNQAMKAIDATPGLRENFERARLEYNQYNKGLINFLVQTGAISKETGARLADTNDYIPFYRERGGVAELMIGGEAPIRVGSIAEQPYLHELVGGDEPIIDFLTSSVQNTNILTDMGLRNLATKNAVFELANMDLAQIGKGRQAGPDVVKFKVDGEERYAIIDTDKAGIPADILVKGMEGIPTQMPMAFRVLGAPAKLLRKAVTMSPLYAAKQLFRDSLAAPLLAGADFTPVMGAIKEIGSATKGTLESRGITGGQIFTGTSEDLTRILKEINAGKSNWAEVIGKLETVAMEADAVTRRAQYNSYIKQGLSEMESTLMSLESMNFNKRGASPSIHVIGAMIPFFNAQIQSLNVLYKALSGKMPFNERLKIQEKLMQRGMMLAAGTLAYTAMMQDDEAYKNATPEQKYGNWFIRLPGVDEPLRLPIPFEVGYIFKALPEALYNSMVDEHGGEEAVKAFRQIILQTIPGGTSYGIPQAMRPAIEAGLGKSFYTGRDIMSAHEKALLPEDQFRANTSEVAKTVGKVAGVSPIVLEQLVQGYTGTMGLALLQAVGMAMPTKEGPEGAYKRLSEMPVVGGAFQPNDAGAIINRVYERMGEYKKVETTVKDLINRGEKARALELVNERGNEFVAAQVADTFTTTMRNLTQLENAVRASGMPPEQKREKLDEIRQAKIKFARTVEQASDRSRLP